MDKDIFISILLENTIGSTNMAEFARQCGISDGIVRAIKFGSQKYFQKKEIILITKRFPHINSEWLASNGSIGSVTNEVKKNKDTTASERIKELLEYLALTPMEFSNAVGVNPDKIYAVRSGKQKSITTPLAYQIQSVYKNVSAEWLITGNGDMLKLNFDDDEQEVQHSTDSDRSQIAELRELVKEIRKERTEIHHIVDRCHNLLSVIENSIVSISSESKQIVELKTAFSELIDKISGPQLNKKEGYHSSFASEDIHRD